MYSNFIDLDELIVLCRDKSTKKFIQESVACYRAGGPLANPRFNLIK